ncbi:uncharacterized protein LOC135104012 [Scylla paramamosain]|uniref:uncharacterized protein LOC135104012 n=1 Tax=Scylla paramamosain TaxID=85552 RepID=UPI003083D5B1
MLAVKGLSGLFHPSLQSSPSPPVPSVFLQSTCPLSLLPVHPSLQSSPSPPVPSILSQSTRPFSLPPVHLPPQSSPSPPIPSPCRFFPDPECLVSQHGSSPPPSSRSYYHNTHEPLNA